MPERTSRSCDGKLRIPAKRKRLLDCCPARCLADQQQLQQQHPLQTVGWLQQVRLSARQQQPLQGASLSHRRNPQLPSPWQARDGHGGSALHKAAGTANPRGVTKLIELGANVNATNFRGQSPVDMVRESNTAVKKLIQAAGGEPSPSWDGVSGRVKDVPGTRKQHQGASAARQQRAATWREVQRSGSQPEGQGGKGSGSKGSGSQPGTRGTGQGKSSGSQWRPRS